MGPDRDMRTVLFSEVHSVNTLALTIIFWWIAAILRLNTTELEVSVIKSMTFSLYKKVLKATPDVDCKMPLCFTLFRSDVTKMVSLLIVKRCWALFVAGMVHDPDPVKGS